MTNDSMNSDELTIVLPCYNPLGEWGDVVIKSISAIEKELNQSVALIIVNDGSNNNNVDEQIERINQKLSRFQYISYSSNKGKGHALRQGVLHSKSKLTLYTDIDFPYTLQSAVDVFRELKIGTSVVLGHRGQHYYNNTPWFRKVISKTLRWFLKSFLRLPTDDSQCGIKGFNTQGKEAFLSTKIDRFLFDLEFIKIASKRHLNCKTVAVNLKPNVVFSKVNLKILITEAMNFFLLLIKK